MTSSASLCNLLWQPLASRLIAVRKGVADEQLAKIVQDRKDRTEAGNSSITLRRSRSVSSHSSTSVSTISTNMSRSPSPERVERHRLSHARETDKTIGNAKRRKSRDASMSYGSDSSDARNRGKAPEGQQPDPRLEPSSRRHGGQDRNRSSGGQNHSSTLSTNQKRRRSRAPSVSHTSDSSYSDRRRSKSIDNARRTRPRRSKASPDNRGRDRWSGPPRNSRRTRSRSNSMDRSRIARERRSMTPDIDSGWGSSGTAKEGPGIDKGRHQYPSDNDRYGSSFKNREQEDRRPPRPRAAPPPPPPRKERSLSPFSKRLALTQAMNMGR